MQGQKVVPFLHRIYPLQLSRKQSVYLLLEGGQLGLQSLVTMRYYKHHQVPILINQLESLSK